MKWKEILLKSWDYIKKYRALWYLGILAALAGGASGGNFSNFSNTGNSSGLVQSTGNKIVDWISGHGPEVAIIAVALILVGLVFIYISYSAQAGLIIAIDSAESGDKKPEFHQAFHTGQKYFWRFLGLSVLISIMIFATVFVLIGLISVLVILVAAVSLWFLILAIPVGLLLLFGILVLIIYLYWILTLGYREIVIKNKKITVAMTEARHIIHNNFTNVVLAWLIEAAVNLIAGVATLIAFMVVGGILFGIGVGIYFAAGTVAAIIYGGVAGVVFVALALLIKGIIAAYFSTYWTIVYKKLKAVS